MTKKLEQLKEILATVADLNGAAALLGWDQQTYMPPGGAEDRGNQLATLGRLSHDMFISPKIVKLLEGLKKEFEGADPDSDDVRLIKVTTRDYEQATRVPSDFVAEMAQVTTLAQPAWAEARQKSDFSIFQPLIPISRACG